VEKVLVIGGAGYVGSQLVPSLLESGRFVRVFDTFWYGHNHFQHLADKNLQLIQGDIRNIIQLRSALESIDVVIHLACVSNDPSFDLNPALGKTINLDCFPPFIDLLNKSSVTRFIYASSSSVYGIREELTVSENLELKPLTDYSKYKAMCEAILLNEVSDNIISTVVRPATICGFSLRQRFDLVVNILTAQAIRFRQIKVFGGSQYRPNLDIRDMVDAYLALLDSNPSSIHKEVFNIGSKNLKVDEIALAVQAEIGSDIEIMVEETNDLRSYRIDSTKISKAIGFTPKFSINESISNLRDNFYKFNSLNPLTDSKFVNILRMKELNLG